MANEAKPLTFIKESLDAAKGAHSYLCLAIAITSLLATSLRPVHYQQAIDALGSGHEFEPEGIKNSVQRFMHSQKSYQDLLRTVRTYCKKHLGGTAGMDPSDIDVFSLDVPTGPTLGDLTPISHRKGSLEGSEKNLPFVIRLPSTPNALVNLVRDLNLSKSKLKGKYIDANGVLQGGTIVRAWLEDAPNHYNLILRLEDFCDNEGASVTYVAVCEKDPEAHEFADLSPYFSSNEAKLLARGDALAIPSIKEYWSSISQMTPKNAVEWLRTQRDQKSEGAPIKFLGFEAPQALSINLAFFLMPIFLLYFMSQIQTLAAYREELSGAKGHPWIGVSNSLVGSTLTGLSLLAANVCLGMLYAFSILVKEGNYVVGIGDYLKIAVILGCLVISMWIWQALRRIAKLVLAGQALREN